MEQMHFKFNFNQLVKVRLKQEGIDILRQQHDEFRSKYKGLRLSPFTINIDDEGYTSFQMWDLMQRFGEYMTLGFDTPFHLDVIICDGEPIERVGRVRKL
jgi:hypothetical protein